jgi:phosphatidylserine/phosphatidylglycerophosphate/cardiolipin synthase-like enzyme
VILTSGTRHFFANILLVLAAVLLSFTGCIPGAILTPTGQEHDSVVPLPIPTPSGTPDVSPVITTYFTDPAIKGKNSPGQAVIAALIKDIYAAKNSIDVAMYNFTHKEIIEALIKASQTGIAVRILVDSDALDKLDLSRLKRVGIYTMGDRRESLMHNKFVVIDNRILWTGSLNLSASGAENDENVMARIKSAELAANYLIKFNEMFNEDKFGADSRPKTSQTEFNIEGVDLENYFSPEDEIDTRLISLVNNAEKSVHVLAYSFTLDRLADALINASLNGVKVRGVFDRESTEENQGADFSKLAKARLDVRLDGEMGLMHIKAIIIDGKTVAFGSYNFTASAENRNDENILIITDPALAASFEDAFERIYAKAK